LNPNAFQTNIPNGDNTIIPSGSKINLPMNPNSIWGTPNNINVNPNDGISYDNVVYNPTQNISGKSFDDTKSSGRLEEEKQKKANAFYQGIYNNQLGNRTTGEYLYSAGALGAAARGINQGHIDAP
jgi:hypothetical protein